MTEWQMTNCHSAQTNITAYSFHCINFFGKDLRFNFDLWGTYTGAFAAMCLHLSQVYAPFLMRRRYTFLVLFVLHYAFYFWRPRCLTKRLRAFNNVANYLLRWIMNQLLPPQFLIRISSRLFFSKYMVIICHMLPHFYDLRFIGDMNRLTPETPKGRIYCFCCCNNTRNIFRIHAGREMRHKARPGEEGAVVAAHCKKLHKP